MYVNDLRNKLSRFRYSRLSVCSSICLYIRELDPQFLGYRSKILHVLFTPPSCLFVGNADVRQLQHIAAIQT